MASRDRREAKVSLHLPGRHQIQECEGKAERKRGSIVEAESRADLRTLNSYMPASCLVMCPSLRPLFLQSTGGLWSEMDTHGVNVLEPPCVTPPGKAEERNEAEKGQTVAQMGRSLPRRDGQ